MARHYQTSYRYWLVDEFQDTNGAQYALLRRMAGDAFRESSSLLPMTTKRSSNGTARMFAVFGALVQRFLLQGCSASDELSLSASHRRGRQSARRLQLTPCFVEETG